MTSNGQPDWAAVRQAYCYGDMTVREICHEYGISDRQLYKRKREENWPDRPRGGARPKTLFALGDRLRRVVERQLFHLEQRLTSDQAPPEGSATQRERDARTMSALVRIYEKLIALNNDAKGAAAGDADASANHGYGDINQRRYAIARRLAGLREPGGA